MKLPSAEENARAQLRKGVYLLLIVLAAGGITARIMAVTAVDKMALDKYRMGQQRKKDRAKYEKEGLSGDALDEKMAERELKIRTRYNTQRPFLSGNDRSRWCTVRALVEHGTYEIDAIVAEPGWDTIDMVKHPNREGEDRLYSSKPTLLPTIVAAEYWVIHYLTGETLGERPFVIGRFMLVTINVIPLAIALLLLSLIVERYGTSDWGRTFVMAAASFGTLLLPFSLASNNHLIAAVCATVMIYAVLRVWYDDQRGLHWFFLAGLFGALMAAFELPALSVLAMVTAGLLWKHPRRTLQAFTPALVIVIAGFFSTQYVAHDTLIPAYMHRKAGARLGEIGATHREALSLGEVSASAREALAAEGVELNGEVLVEARSVMRKTRSKVYPGWEIRDEGKRYSVFDEGETLSVYAWDDWYEYTFRRTPKDKLRTSYWSEIKKKTSRAKIDRGEPSRAVYALHCLVGHHGIFSLTPIWFLSVIGLVQLVRGRLAMWELALLIGLSTVVCFLFYSMFVPAEDRNYGGTSSGLRWMIWFTPLWLIAMIPAADVASRWRWSRYGCLLLLTLSVLSANYPTWNPWRHPWLWNLMEYLEWI